MTYAHNQFMPAAHQSVLEQMQIHVYPFPFLGHNFTCLTAVLSVRAGTEDPG